MTVTRTAHWLIIAHATLGSRLLEGDEAETLAADLTPAQRERLRLGHAIQLPGWLADAWQGALS